MEAYLVEEAQGLVEPGFWDLKLEGIVPIPFSSICEGENQCHGCTALH